MESGVPLPPGIPGIGGSTDPLEAVLGPFPCARLRSLPFDATLEDILILFQGLVVIDVVLVGQGEAYVVFANPMDYQMALQRDRQTIGRSFVEITPGSRSEYYKSIARQHSVEHGDSSGRRSSDDRRSGDDRDELRKGGDSWGSSGDRGGYSRGPSDRPLGPPSDRYGGGDYRRSGSGSGRFDNLGGPSRDRLAPGMTRTTITPTGVIVKRTGGGIQVGEHTGYLRMRGLPFAAMKEDIYDFFKEYNPILESIVLTYRNDGRATGEAYVGFETPEDSQRAMDLHRKSMGTRYIELFLSNREEHGRAMARFGDR